MLTLRLPNPPSTLASITKGLPLQDEFIYSIKVSPIKFIIPCLTLARSCLIVRRGAIVAKWLKNSWHSWWNDSTLATMRWTTSVPRWRGIVGEWLDLLLPSRSYRWVFPHMHPAVHLDIITVDQGGADFGLQGLSITVEPNGELGRAGSTCWPFWLSTHSCKALGLQYGHHLVIIRLLRPDESLWAWTAMHRHPWPLSSRGLLSIFPRMEREISLSCPAGLEPSDSHGRDTIWPAFFPRQFQMEFIWLGLWALTIIATVVRDGMSLILPLRVSVLSRLMEVTWPTVLTYVIVIILHLMFALRSRNVLTVPFVRANLVGFTPHFLWHFRRYAMATFRSSGVLISSILESPSFRCGWLIGGVCGCFLVLFYHDSMIFCEILD